MVLTLVSESRPMQLNELAQLRDGAYENTRIYKERTKKWHDSRLCGDKDFKVGKKLIRYNSRLKMYPGKLKLKWSGPNIVKRVYPYGAVEIINRSGFSFKVNRQRLKKYYEGNIDKEDDEVIEFENGTIFKVPPYPFNYPTRRLNMEETLAKFIDEGKREHKEMEIFIKEFRTTNELLLKEQSNLLSELKIKEKPHDVGMKNKSSSIPERTTQPLVKPQSSFPFLNQVINEKEEEQQRFFFENLKQLHINIPFIEALVQMPKYTKYLKSLLANKPRLEEACTVTMNERCSTVLLNKLPSKEKDPGSFTIPCQVSHLQINNALADLGASISLMPYMMYEKLGLGEPKPTRMSFKLADSSIQYPRGIVKNVLINVDKFVLPIDFVILDMPEDSRIMIILERPFLATARAMIDDFYKKITLRVGDDEVIFNMDHSIKKPPTKDDECHGINDTINIETQELLENDQLDLFLLKGLEKSINQPGLESCNSIGDEFANNSDVDLSIRHIDPVNTLYSDAQETEGTDRVKNKHLYSASTNKIDEKNLS
ncbi:DNA-directed DNA polymerase [Tanacetum coccineum]